MSSFEEDLSVGAVLDASNEHRQLSQELELTDGLIVQEVGWDDDIDPAISEAIEDVIGSELLGEDSYEVCDIVLLWWRDGDGDLVDTLVDVISPLADEGFVWLLTPKIGSDYVVDVAVISEAATTAGLKPTRTTTVGDWVATKLAPQRIKRR